MSDIVNPAHEKFVYDYATSTRVISLEEWGGIYGVCRQTIAEWIKTYATNIEEIRSQYLTEFNMNLHRTRDKALKLVDEALDNKDLNTALKMMPFYTPKKDSVDVNGNIEVNQPLAIAIKNLRENSNVSGAN